MKKRLLTLIIVFSITFIPTTVFASSVSPTLSDNQVTLTSTDDGTVTPDIVHTIKYSKTITKWYTSYPNSNPIYYTEYVSYYQSWATGWLALQSVVYTNGGWLATYSGTMFIVVII